MHRRCVHINAAVSNKHWKQSFMKMKRREIFLWNLLTSFLFIFFPVTKVTNNFFNHFVYRICLFSIFPKFFHLFGRRYILWHPLHMHMLYVYEIRISCTRKCLTIKYFSFIFVILFAVYEILSVVTAITIYFLSFCIFILVLCFSLRSISSFSPWYFLSHIMFQSRINSLICLHIEKQSVSYT